MARRKTTTGQILREGAMSIAKSKHLALGQYYRRLKGRRTEAVATVAVARKLAEFYYAAMTRGLEYVEQGLARYEELCRQQAERHLQKMAARLGYTLHPAPPQPA
jgi:pyruvate-formate lyase